MSYKDSSGEFRWCESVFDLIHLLMSKFLNLYLMIRRLIDAIVIKMTDPHFKPSKMRDGLFWESERCLR